LLNIDNKFYRDQIEISTEEVYQKMLVTNVLTSLPNLEDYLSAIEDFKKDGYTDVLVITISSGLSGTYNAFVNLQEEIKGIKVHLYDSKTLSMAQGYMVEEACKLIRENMKVSDIIKKLDDLRYNNLEAMFTIETLKWLRKGGRIGLVEGTIGEILHVKPIIAVNDEGKYHTLSKGFGMKRAFITMRKLLKEKYEENSVEITIHYGDNLDTAKDIAEKLESDLNVKKISITPLTPVLGVHTGPSMIAIICRKI
jgi:DegV family protein with EDD domain